MMLEPSSWLGFAEDAVYLATAVLLAAIALVLLVSIARGLLRSLRDGPILKEALKALDALLLVLMIVELLHTIRFILLEHTLAPEPFLVVALIAGVRRVLILTTEASQFIQEQPEQFRMALLEMALITASFFVLSGSIVLLRYFPSP